MAQKIAVINDQNGDACDCTLKELPDYQARGYRIADVGTYNAAVAALDADQQDAAVSAGEAATAEQSAADASAAAATGYPDAKPTPADKPATQKR